MSDIYLDALEMEELKLIIGGTDLQDFHLDFEAEEDMRQDAEDEGVFLKANAMLLTCHEEKPARLAVLNPDGKESESWKQVKSAFRRADDKTRASITDNSSQWPPHAIFRCAGLVFDGAVPHAGVPVQHYSQAKDGSAIKKLEKQKLEKQKGTKGAEVDLAFLKSIDGLSEITRLFITTWPMAEFGPKDLWVKKDKVDIVQKWAA